MQYFARPSLWALALGLLFVARAAAADPSKVAGADVGSKGIRAVIVEYDSTVKGPGAVKVTIVGTRNPNLGALSKEGMFLPDRLAESVDDLSHFATEFRKAGVKDADIHLVGSSSIIKSKNLDALTAAVKEKTGLTMTYLPDRAEEARLEARGLVYLGKPAEGLLITIGNGNSAARVDKPEVAFEVPFGTGTLTDKATELEKAKNLSFPKAVEEARTAVLLPALRAAIMEKPALKSQTRATTIGGIFYAIATLSHPEAIGDTKVRTIALSPADCKSVMERLEKSEFAPPTLDLKAIADPEVRAQVEKELKNIRNIFPSRTIYAGAALVLTLGEVLEMSDKPWTFIKDTQYAWIVGYLANKVGADKPVPGGGGTPGGGTVGGGTPGGGTPGGGTPGMGGGVGAAATYYSIYPADLPAFYARYGPMGLPPVYYYGYYPPPTPVYYPPPIPGPGR